MKTVATALIMAAGLAFSAHAQDSLPGQSLIASPAIDHWALGGNSNHRMIHETGVPGGWALNVKLAGAGANPWDVQAGVATTRAIHKGDVVLLAFWARTAAPPPGDTSAHIIADIQQGHAPYARIGDATLNVSGTWKLYYVSGTSQLDLQPGEAAATVQLATAEQEIELGPVFLRDFGQGYDPAKLPVN